MNRADPAGRDRRDRPVPRARRAAHVPPGRRRRQPRQRPAQRPQFQLRDFNRAARPDPHRRRQIVARSVDDRRRAEVPARLPAGRAVRAASSATSRSSFGNTGVEATYNERARGPRPAARAQQHRRRARGKDDRGNVVLVDAASSSSAAARDALGDQHGSVVVLDLKTGGVVAMYSNPTFDPQPLAGHDTAGRAGLRAAPAAPTRQARRCRARTASAIPPGSTFKVDHGVGRRSTPGTATPDTDFPIADRARPAADQQHADELRRRVVRRHARARASSSRATRRSARSGSTSASSSPRASSSSASSTRAAARPRARRRRERRARRRARSSRTSRCSRSPASARATSP